MCGISLALYILAIVYKIIIFIIALERKVIMKNKYNILEDQPIKVILFFFNTGFIRIIFSTNLYNC